MITSQLMSGKVGTARNICCACTHMSLLGRAQDRPQIPTQLASSCVQCNSDLPGERQCLSRVVIRDLHSIG